MQYIRIHKYSQVKNQTQKPVNVPKIHQQNTKYYSSPHNEKPVDWEKMKENLNILRNKGLISLGSFDFESLDDL